MQTFTFDRYENVGSILTKRDPRKHRYEERSREMVRLLFTAASGDVTSMRRYFKSGFDMEAVDYDGRTVKQTFKYTSMDRNEIIACKISS